MKRSTSLKRTAFTRKNDSANTTAKQPQSHGQQALPAIISVVKRRTNYATVAAFQGGVPKAQPVRSDAYRRLVAALPCCICGIAGQSQAAHGSAGKGMGIKACDTTLFPACAARPGIAGCHAQLDQGALYSKAVRHALEPAWAADTQRRIHAMGKWPKAIPYPHDDKKERPHAE